MRPVRKISSKIARKKRKIATKNRMIATKNRMIATKKRSIASLKEQSRNPANQAELLMFWAMSWANEARAVGSRQSPMVMVINAMASMKIACVVAIEGMMRSSWL